MDFLYDIFYEVLSEEGIWVLILIASAFAVASFILFTLRIETSPKSSVISQGEKKPQKEKRPKGKKETKKVEEPESTETTPESKTDLPPSPEMTSPDTFTHPEIVLPGSAPYKHIPQPVAGQEPESAIEEAPGPVFDPFEVAPLPVLEQASTIDAEPAATPAAEQPIEIPDKLPELKDAAISASMEGGRIGVRAASQQPGDNQEFENEQESEEKPQEGDIFSLFGEVDAEDEEFAEFARGLDDIGLSGLLTETEDLSQQLKDIMTKHKT